MSAVSLPNWISSLNIYSANGHGLVDDYPSSHTYFVYTTSENVDRKITKALEDFSLPEGVKLTPMLIKVAKILGKATASSQTRHPSVSSDAMDIDNPVSVPGEGSDSGDDLDAGYGDGSEPEEEDEDDYSPPPSNRLASSTGPGRLQYRMNQFEQRTIRELRTKLRQDILATKQAGFRVGLLGDLSSPEERSFLTISCRISRLGISQEAMQAWHLDASCYLILVIQFPRGYKTLQQISDESPTHNNINIQMRVGSSAKYKITLTEACSAFRESKMRDKERNGLHVVTQEPSKIATSGQAASSNQEPMNMTTNLEGFNQIFISRPLNELLNQRLSHLINYRVNLGMPWGGAELYYNSCQGKQVNDVDPTQSRFLTTENAESYKHLPKLVTSDHLNDSSLIGYTAKGSFPLLAMQFTLRHVVRCTEFCLVCHTKIDVDFEALKPYVCSNPLCLYQYLNLGMGPAIEHEILTQPDVVDLLVSFCYASAQTNRLKSPPIGMTLMVPPMTHVVPSMPYPDFAHPNLSFTLPPAKPTTSKATKAKDKDVVKSYPAKLDRIRSELIFDESVGFFRPGDWICIVERDKETEEKVHYKVVSISYQCLCLGPPIHTGVKSDMDVAIARSSISASISSCVEVDVYRYDQLFDELPRQNQIALIGPLLNTLPSIHEMAEYLQAGPGRSLEQWSDRISPTALGLLRWIIASNRSCIIQVDNHGSKDPTEERVGGMPGYLQFRFAQGAPDKEQRFINAIHENSRKNKPKQSTIFAWHGSKLSNWHGIVREGLNFEETMNGRAFGHGVYVSCVLKQSLNGS